MRHLLTLTGVTVLLLSSHALCAHGDLHEQIDALTAQIKKEPRKADLYVQRGELHRAHGDWDAALADFDYTGTLDPKWPTLDFLRGRVFAEARWLQSAKVSLDRFLSRQTNHVEALIIRGRVLVQLSQRLAAAQDFSRALAHTTESRPEIYVERAQTLTAEGEAHYREALQGLEEGIKKLGPLVTLQLYAIDLELKQKRTDAALARLDQVAAQYPRKETWLARRGEILRDAGRPDEAREAFRAALAALNQLPPVRRNVPAMQELEQRLRTALETPAANAGALTPKPEPPAPQ